MRARARSCGHFHVDEGEIVRRAARRSGAQHVEGGGSPVSALPSVTPQRINLVVQLVRLVALSSTISTRNRRARRAAGLRDDVFGYARAYAEVEARTLPSVLSTSIVPPSLDELFRNASPSPCRRICAWCEPSGLGKRMEERPELLRREPSRYRYRQTRRRHPHHPAHRRELDFDDDSPFSVNLMALFTRFGEYLAQPSRVAVDARGTSRALGTRARCLTEARSAKARRRPRKLVHVDRDRLELGLPASILEKSRLSLMIESSASPNCGSSGRSAGLFPQIGG